MMGEGAVGGSNGSHHVKIPYIKKSMYLRLGMDLETYFLGALDTLWRVELGRFLIR